MRRAALVAGCLGTVLAFLVARAAAIHYARLSAERCALTIAAYLPVVAPPATASGDNDLEQLLVQARGLALLPGWDGAVEVYHGTAPLIEATAPPLSPGQLERLRRVETIEWLESGRVVLVPFMDRERWDVVGAVAVRIPASQASWGNGWGWLGIVPAIFVMLLAALAFSRPAVVGFYSVGAVVFACGAALSIQLSVWNSTARWVRLTQTLVQNAERAPARPSAVDLRSLVGEGTLLRPGSGRLPEIQAPPAHMAGWLLGALLLGLIGSGIVAAASVAAEGRTVRISAS